MGVLKVYDGSGFVEVPNLLAPNAVTAAAVLADFALVCGEGGVRGVRTRSAGISAAGVVSIPGIGDGGFTSYDLLVGDTITADYGMIRFGDGVIGRTSYNVAACDLDGTVIIRQLTSPVSSKIEFAILESGGQAIRWAVAKSAAGNTTYSARSGIFAGPAVLDDEIVTVGYWQAQGIFHNLACDTAGDGADLAVQNDLEVEGDIFVDSIKESTVDAGIIAEAVLLKDGLVDGVDVAAHAADGDAHHNESHDADSHPDIDTTTDPPVLNDVMKWNGSDWVPGTAGDTTEFTFSIDSFAGTETDSNQLIGSGTWVASGAMSFSATYSNAPGGMTALVTMTGTATGWSTLVMDPVTGAEPTVADTSYPSSPGDTVTFTLTQSADASTAVDTVQFNNTMRYGTNALVQGNQTEASLEALTEVAGPNESRSQSINNIPNAPTDYVTFAYATRLTASADIEQIRVNSGLGWVTAAFAAAATTLKPDLQAAVPNVDNSASFVENFDCVTSLIAGLANGTNDFQVLTTPTASNYMFWGELAKASSYTEADVEDNIASEPGQVVSNDMSSREMTVNAAGGEYTYIAYPARLGALTSIIIGGFESIGDFNVDSTALAITNDAGYQENYRVYVSVNPGFTDPTTMTVTI